LQSAIIPVARQPILGVIWKMCEMEDGSMRRSGTFFWVTNAQEFEPRSATAVRPEDWDAALKAYSIW